MTEKQFTIKEFSTQEMNIVMYGVFDEEESMYLLYAIDFFDADLFMKERGLGNRLRIDMVDLKITGKIVIKRNIREEDFR